ncbi:hypothetical protein [Antrihabitans spumae]|uniref:Uncharacterized protein n=1 Tax=Antrihabitans spumae TaxID=3373370 RepID=A0ABW7KGP3_9NOCA
MTQPDSESAEAPDEGSRTEQKVEAMLSEFEIEPTREGRAALDVSFNDTDEDETGL